jgi:hypothetical protein
MTAMIDEQTRLLRLRAAEAQPPSSPVDYLTNFERKFRLEGRSIFRACYQK